MTQDYSVSQHGYVSQFMKKLQVGCHNI